MDSLRNCTARSELTLKPIACGLNNLQKILDGEPLGGKASAESDFASDEDDDFLD